MHELGARVSYNGHGARARPVEARAETRLGLPDHTRARNASARALRIERSARRSIGARC